MADPITEESLGTQDQEDKVTDSPDTQPATTSKSQAKREAIQKSAEDEKYEEMINRGAVDPASLSDADRENILGWKRRKTIARLNAEKKIRMIIPFQVGEDKNNRANWYYPFGINGVFIQVRKGQYVEVPESVFNLYQDSMREVTSEESKAAENLMGNIDLKFDAVTGKKKSVDFLTY